MDMEIVERVALATVSISLTLAIASAVVFIAGRASLTAYKTALVGFCAAAVLLWTDAVAIMTLSRTLTVEGLMSMTLATISATAAAMLLSACRKERTGSTDAP